MKQIKAHFAVSLDGFIATPDHELDWIPQSVKSQIGKEIATADTLLIGTNTYTYIFEHWRGWPYKGKRSFVVSSNDINVTPNCGVDFLTNKPLNQVYKLKQENDLLVVGSSKLLTSLIKTNLLDCLTVYTVPIILGEEVRFMCETLDSKWKLDKFCIMDDFLYSSFLRV